MSDLEKELHKTAKQLIQKATNRQNRPLRKVTYNAAVLSIYGFQVAIPVLITLFIGYYLDKYFPHESISWIVNFVILGFILGIFDATLWLKNSYQVKGQKK